MYPLLPSVLWCTCLTEIVVGGGNVEQPVLRTEQAFCALLLYCDTQIFLYEEGMGSFHQLQVFIEPDLSPCSKKPGREKSDYRNRDNCFHISPFPMDELDQIFYLQYV